MMEVRAYQTHLRTGLNVSGGKIGNVTRALSPSIAVILESFGEELTWWTPSKVSGPKSYAFFLYLLIHGR